MTSRNELFGATDANSPIGSERQPETPAFHPDLKRFEAYTKPESQNMPSLLPDVVLRNEALDDRSIAAAKSMSKHKGTLTAAAIESDVSAFRNAGKHQPDLLTREYNHSLYRSRGVSPEADAQRQRSQMDRLREQIVLSRAEGENHINDGLTPSKANLLNALGKLNFIAYDHYQPKQLLAEVARYQDETRASRSDFPLHKSKSDEPTWTAAKGLDIGGLATDALIQSSTKSIWAQRSLVGEAASELANLGITDASKLLSFDEKSKRFSVQEGSPDSVYKLVTKLNANLGGLDNSKATVDKEIDGITSMNSARSEGHDFNKIWLQEANAESGLGLPVGTRFGLPETISGIENYAQFKTSKLIPIYDNQYRIAKDEADNHPSQNPLDRAQQVLTVAYFREEADKQRISATKLYRDAAFMNMIYDMSQFSDASPKAKIDLDQARAIERQLVEQGLSPAKTSADQANLEQFRHTWYATD